MNYWDVPITIGERGRFLETAGALFSIYSSNTVVELGIGRLVEILGMVLLQKNKEWRRGTRKVVRNGLPFACSSK